MEQHRAEHLAEAPIVPASVFSERRPEQRRRSQFQRIMVPLDFARRSWRGLNYAVSLAEPLRARVSLLHVVVPDTHPLTHPVRLYRLPQLLTNARRRLARLQAVLQRRGLDGEVLACVGLPFEQITATARELQADLLVMTPHGRHGLKRFLIGSTFEMVLRHAPCPVLVVRAGKTLGSSTTRFSHANTSP